MAGQSHPDDSWTGPSLPSNVVSVTESLRFASAPQTTQGPSIWRHWALAEHADGDEDEDAGKV